MRLLKLSERKKRGCTYCMDMVIITDEDESQHMNCPHEKCPYKVLDKYESYEDFMESEDSKILVDNFFQQAGNCFTVAQPEHHHKRWKFDVTLRL